MRRRKVHVGGAVAEVAELTGPQVYSYIYSNLTGDAVADSNMLYIMAMSNLNQVLLFIRYCGHERLFKSLMRHKSVELFYARDFVITSKELERLVKLGMCDKVLEYVKLVALPVLYLDPQFFCDAILKAIDEEKI